MKSSKSINNISLSPSEASNSIIRTGEAKVAIKKGQLVGYKAGGYVLATNTDYTTMVGIGIASADAAAGANFSILIQGDYAVASNDGKIAYVGTNGAITYTKPTAANACLRVVGHVEGSVLKFYPNALNAQMIDDADYNKPESFTGNVVGICYFQKEANGPWTWARVNEDGTPLTKNINFDNFAPWSGVKTQTIDEQVMVKIPKFYVKAGTIENGEYKGAKARWISSVKKDGYHIHPAFVKNGFVMDCFYMGAYEASGNPSSSIAGVQPVNSSSTGSGTRQSWSTRSGFDFISWYTIAAVNYLLLVELGTPDAQTAIGRGNVDSSTIANTGSTNAVYRGIHEWWGNQTEFIKDSALSRTGTLVFSMPSNQGDNTKISSPSLDFSGFFNDLNDYHVTRLDFNDLFLPSAAVSAEDISLIPDKINFYKDRNSETIVVRSRTDGPFALDTSFVYNYSSTYGHYGARIVKDGTVTTEVAPNR